MERQAPPSIHFLLLIVLSCVIAWLPVTGLGIDAVSAAMAAERDGRNRTTTSKTPSRVKGTTATLAPATIRDFRVWNSPDKTRLVIDLDRLTKVIERRAQNPNRVVIALPNAAMTSSAHAKTTDGTLPAPLRVTQNAAPSVVLSLPTDAFDTYKQFTLSDPPRLVVDITPPIQAVMTPDTPLPAQSTAQFLQPMAPPAKGYKTIVIDPGHGGKDPGARGLRHTEEKDITLKVGLKLRDLLSKQPGLRVLMTREQDVFVELEDRAKFANSHAADLFISIHVNSHPSRQVRGIEIYHFGQAKDQRALEVAARENGTPLSTTGVGWEYLVADLLATKKVEASLELAWTAKETMMARMNGQYTLHDHGVKTAPFYVLRFTSMPSILAEIAYISNPVEEGLLRKPAFIRDVAESLFQGVQTYLSNTQSPLR